MVQRELDLVDMHIKITMNDGLLLFEFTLEEDEPKAGKSAMVSSSFYVQGPHDWSLDEIHPDHLALSSLLVVRPWFNKTLSFSFPVSHRFSEACKAMNINVQPVDKNIDPYDTMQGKYIALAFSGGADSTAALSVLPPSTIPIFLDRPITPGSLYSKEAALFSCNKLIQLGYDCQIIPCDLEEIRKPIGFPTDLANGVPAILLAGRLKIFGIAYGTVLESLYGIGRIIFKDYVTTNHYASWWDVFSSAGLPLSFPTGGISEVGTELICSKSGIGNLAQSCIRGRPKEPCNFCWKCFRKKTLRAAIGTDELNISTTLELLKSNEVCKKLEQLPISHENVLIYAFSKLDLTNYPNGFIQRFNHSDDLSYLEHWYAPSVDLIDDRIKVETENRIISFIGKNTVADEKNLESWDNTARINRLEPLVVNLLNVSP